MSIFNFSKQSHHFRATVLLTGSIAVIACGNDNKAVDLAAAEVSQDTAALVTDNVTAASDAINAFTELELLTLLTDLFDRFVAPTATDVNGAPPLPSAFSFITAPPDGAVGPDAGNSPQDDIQSITDDITHFITEVVLTNENFVSSTATTAIFAVPTSDICASEMCTEIDYSQAVPDPVTGAYPEPVCTTEIDQPCVDFFTELNPQVAVTPGSNGSVKISLRIGPNHLVPLTFEAAPEQLAVEIDFDAALSSYDLAHAIAVGQDYADDFPEIPGTLSGLVRAQLDITGTDAFTATFSIVRAINVSATDPDSGETITASIAAASPLAVLDLDAVTETAALALTAGSIDISLPWAMLMNGNTSNNNNNNNNNNNGMSEPAATDAPSAASAAPRTFTGTLALHLDGLSASGSLNQANNEIVLTNLGLGNAASTIKKDGVTLASINLNADHGRHFAITVTPDDANNSAKFSFSPALQLELTIALATVAADMNDPEWPEDDIPMWLHANDLTLSLSAGASGNAVVEPFDEAGTTPAGLKVIEGTLNLSSTYADLGSINVTENTCLVESADGLPRTGESHEILQNLDSGVCGL